MLKYGDAAAICHRNPSGWQFSYRYATILLPWMFLLLAGNGPATAGAGGSLDFRSGCPGRRPAASTEERLQVWELQRHVEQQMSKGVQRNIAEQTRHLARVNCRDLPIDGAIFFIEQRDPHRLAPALYHTLSRAEGARYRNELDAVVAVVLVIRPGS